MTWQILRGDCVEEMVGLDDCSVDAIVTDPPYGLEFMGKEWDRLLKAPSGSAHARQHSVSFVNPGNPTCRNCGGLKSLESEGSGGRTKCRCEQPDFPNHLLPRARAMQEWHQAWATEALRVLKPGGHLLAFGGTRTYHRLAAGVEDAGFEIRDTICWMYGSGFPKSLNVGVAIDKAAGAERTEIIGKSQRHPGKPYDPAKGWNANSIGPEPHMLTAPATPEAERWQGWGTALKPAHEPIVVARKPLAGTVAGNVLEHGTGALNVDGCRVSGEPLRSPLKADGTRSRSQHEGWTWIPDNTHGKPEEPCEVHGILRCTICLPFTGRWPANVVLSHTEDCVQVGVRKVKGGSGWTAEDKAAESGYEGGPRAASGVNYADPDGTETVGSWNCSPGGWESVPVFSYAGLSAMEAPALLSLLRLVRDDLGSLDSRTSDTRTEPSREAERGLGQSGSSDSPGGYRPCPHCNGEPARAVRVAGQGSARQLADALASVLDLGHSPRHSRSHPAVASPSSSDDGRPRSTGCGTPASTESDPVGPASDGTPDHTGRTPEAESPAQRCSNQPSSTSAASCAEPSIPSHSGCTCEGCPRLVATALRLSARFLPVIETVQQVYRDPCPVRLLDEQTGEMRAARPSASGTTGRGAFGTGTTYGEGAGMETGVPISVDDSGGASRFFYVAKASRAERNAGLEGFEEQDGRTMDGGHIVSEGRTAAKVGGPRANHHPTVKPIELMRWLVRLVTPPNGTVLDPFVGSGTTGIAAVLEGFDFIGIEREDEYADIAEARIGWWEKHRGDGQAAAVLAAGEARDEVEATGQLSLEGEAA